MFQYWIHFRKKATIIFITSFFIFMFLNIIENIIHYNIGRNTDDNIRRKTDDNIVRKTEEVKRETNNIKSFKIYVPNKEDWLRIILTMIIFAILQGFFVILFI